MSLAFIRSDFARKVVSAVCLLTFPAAAQQANTGLSLQATPVGAQQAAPSGSQQSGAAAGNQQSATPTPDAPEPRKLPQPTHVDYSKPSPLLPNPFARYIPREVPPPSFTNAPKIEQLIQNGKLMLSLNDAIAIALADNLDIAVARYNLPIADTDILRTKAGSSFLGVNSGVVSNTPGGGQGGIGAGVSGAGAGGTTAGAGGAGVGAGGFVGSTSGAGPQPDNFDPVVTGTFALEQSTSPSNFGLLSGLSGTGATTPLAKAHTTTGNLTYSQGFSPGTAFSIGFNNQRQSTNGSAQTFNPALTSNFRATVRQHLLQGFGRGLNLRFLRTAQNNKKITEEGFRQQVISTVSQIENIYWDLVNAYGAFKVNERSLALAQKTLSDNQKQVEIGTLAPLDVVRAQSSVASAEQALIASRTNLQLQQLTIKNALTRGLPNNSPVVQAEVIPTDTVQIPDQENLPPVDQLVQMALENRPDYRQQKITLKNNEINIKGANNGLLPTVDLIAFYGASGLAGLQNPLGTCPPGVTTQCTPPGTIRNSGFGDSFSNLFNSTGPDKGVQINIQIPLGNRVAQATQVRSLLEYRQSQLSLKTVENVITIGIRNDVFTLENNRASVAAAQKARDLAAQTLDAEQKKYNLGASTYLAVLQDERDLAQSESALVSAMTNYAKARVQLDRDTAQTLDRYNIKIDEAVTGQIKTVPNVPGTIPSKTALQETNTPAQQPPK
ncbi:MAG TPA: TolC family protein [Candidatus Angelobacter sp.]|nr:TolC family protein [Candidatus Angelobacter sp.]